LIQYNQSNPNSQWILLDPSSSAYHMSGAGGEYNVKFVSPDGMFEAVYDSRTGRRVESAKNMGTYNFFGPSNSASHYDYDVVPYYEHGNTYMDSALGFAGANKMWASNLAKYEYDLKAQQHYYDVMRRTNPDAYKAHIDRRESFEFRRP